MTRIITGAMEIRLLTRCQLFEAAGQDFGVQNCRFILFVPIYIYYIKYEAIFKEF